MPKRITSYLYKPGDDPLTVASQFGVTPQQLLAANPGGSPFSVGQGINIPAGTQTFQYSAPIGPQQDTPYNTPPVQDMRGRGYNANQSMLDMRGRGYGQTTAMDQLNAMRGRGYGQTNTLPPQTGTWEDPAPAGITPTPAGNTDFSQTQAAQNYAAAGTSFANQMRWDPQAKKYVSIGRLLKQGKLDLKGNWHKQSKRQKQGAAQQRNQQQAQVEQKQDYTLANSFISFGMGSG